MSSRLAALLLLLVHGAGAQYAGSASCASCHRRQAAAQTSSHHAKALRPIVDSPAFQILQTAAQSPDGALHYQPVATGIQVTAADLAGDALIEWAFGAGVQGITPVGRLAGQYFEHRFSFYPKARLLAPTFGHPPQAHSALQELGVLEENRTINRCFSCHSTAFVSPANLEPGVQCERCHGPGVSHIAAANAGKPQAEIVQAIANPARFAPRAQVQFCGQCHRLPSSSVGDEPELDDPVTVRFAPIGLLASRCFRQSKTLSCSTCHEPHADARPRSDAFYTQQCLACHARTPQPIHLCRRAQQENCLGCHMRQVAFGAYLRFTDHRIR